MLPTLIRIWRIQWCCSLFFVFECKYPFWVNLIQKVKNSHFKLKFGTYTNSNMQNSMVMFIYFVFDWKYPFWANLSKKSKLSVEVEILVPWLIPICRIQWCCWRFFFWVEIPFLGKFGPKSQNYQLNLKFVT